MTYPFPILGKKIFPVAGDQIQGEGLLLSFDDRVMDREYSFADQVIMQQEVDGMLNASGKNWGYGFYLEKREQLFRALDIKQMVEQERFFHLGIDITLPIGAFVYAPLDGEVVEAKYESGEGNYGGYVLLKHNVDGDIFYSLYGHLNQDTLTSQKTVKAGDVLAQLGDQTQNGGYWSHLHLQAFTEKGFEEGFVSKGYCREDQLGSIRLYCPDPTFLFTLASVG